MEIQKTIKQNENKDWLAKELNKTTEQTEYEKLPSPIFEEGKETILDIDISKPFDSWHDDSNNRDKAIVPCKQITSEGETKCTWWLNKFNPVYRQIIQRALENSDKKVLRVKVFRTGQFNNTRYTLVKE